MLIPTQTFNTRTKYLLLACIPIYFMIVGFLLQPWDSIFPGFIKILQEPDFLITDYFVIGGVGAAFFNAGSITLLLLLVLYKMNMKFDGHTITSTCLIFGFSLFGKNVLNIWAILFGVYLYAKFHRTSIKNYLYVGLYGTSLSPIITEIISISTLPISIRVLLGLLIGIIIGFVLPPLSSFTHFAHKGYSLYNVGFSSGIIATVIMSLMKSFGLQFESRLIWDTQHNTIFVIVLSIFFLGMILFPLLHDFQTIKEQYRTLLKEYGLSGSDYTQTYSDYTVLFNMGINGLFSTIFVYLLGADLNGPVIGGIFTIVGFSATGKHLRNIAPVMLGVAIAGLTKQWNIQDPSAILAFLFSTTLAPIAGQYGFLAGIIAGFLHSSVALNVGIVYSGMNLYNNGFAGGLVAIFMVPVIQSIQDRKARAKENLSL